MRYLRITLILALGFFAAPLAAEAQRGEKVPRIGILSPSSAQVSIFRHQFEQGLRERGWVDGQTVHIERRYADGKLERLPESCGRVGPS